MTLSLSARRDSERASRSIAVTAFVEGGPGRRLRMLGVRVEPLTAADAVTAARLWDRGCPAGLSLGDRCCLALAERVGCAAVTADTAWAQLPLDGLALTVRLIR
ncbi:MAG: hypothetical protein JWR81_6102 [Pseudonocardia sp.]|nr:hypothetical protein [Pseudonocardia sp.]